MSKKKNKEGKSNFQERMNSESSFTKITKDELFEKLKIRDGITRDEFDKKFNDEESNNKDSKTEYLDHLKNAAAILQESLDDVRSLIINLAMCGEMEEINNLLNEGDELNFKYEDFKNIKDYNVKLLYEVYDFLEGKRNELLNVNSLEDDELNF